MFNPFSKPILKLLGPYVSPSQGRRLLYVYFDDGSKTTISWARWSMIQHLGRTLEDTEIVHHADHNKLHDEISNYEITSLKEHTRHHKLGSVSSQKGIEKGWQHGTQYSWVSKKCRCGPCVEANDERNERRRQTRGTAGTRYKKSAELVHGQDITLYRKGCRCSDCRKLNAQRARELRNRSR